MLGSKDYDDQLLSSDLFDEAAEVKVLTFDDEDSGFDLRPKRRGDD